MALLLVAMCLIMIGLTAIWMENSDSEVDLGFLILIVGVASAIFSGVNCL